MEVQSTTRDSNMWLGDEFAVLILLQSAFMAMFIAAILIPKREQIAARLASVTALAAVSRRIQISCFQLLWNPHWRATAAPLCWIQFLSASELILVARASERDFQQPQSRSTASSSLSWMGKARTVMSTLWNLRRVGTRRWQVKNTPASPKQSLAEFLWRRAATTLLSYLILDMLVSGPAPDAAFISRQKQTLWNLQALAGEDYVFRTIATASFWVSVALLLLVINNCAAVLGVVCMSCSPSDCPPLFGSFADVTSVRQFWGAAWHQCLRAGLTGHANLVADSVFRVPRGNALSTYIRLWLAFLISGLVHYSSDIAMGIERSEAGSPLFFSLQAFGIMLEDGLEALFKRYGPRETGPTWLSGGGRKIVGRLWVAAFLVWSTPTWFYPQQRLGLDATRLLPVRIVPIILQAVRILVGSSDLPYEGPARVVETVRARRVFPGA